MNNIRNFCIIAHIDHGKSTLADRFLELTNTLSQREMIHGQMLDTMELEQERGITIKLQPARMQWQISSSQLSKYDSSEKTKKQKLATLNLIDTPGHVDFQYEVSRSLAACEGAILVVDASQGIEAQTLSNVYLALEHNLEIIPVLNKIDLPAADPKRVEKELIDLFGFKKEEILYCSAKTGQGVPEILNAVCERIPAPTSRQMAINSSQLITDTQDLSSKTQALIFDSFFDQFQGVVALVRIFSGEIEEKQKIKLVNTSIELEALELGYLRPARDKQKILKTGDVGYIITGSKDIHEVCVGDTITLSKNPASGLPGFKPAIPVVFAGLFPTDPSQHEALRDALEKLTLNDASLTFEPENSLALGFGFRVGFLGLLHLDIIQERLEREYDLDLIATTPSVNYKIQTTKGEVKTISNPANFPERAQIKEIREPFVKIEIITPNQYLGGIFELLTEKHGESQGIEYIDQKRVIVRYNVPLAGIITNFYDRLKSISQGYASVNYEPIGFHAAPLEKMDILIAGEPVDSLAIVVRSSDAYHLGLHLVKKLKEIIPRANFVIPIQAAVGAKILARENIPAFRKDVTAKLYGGDKTRRDKLLKKQKEGKKRMKAIGKVNLPQDAFLAILKK